MHFGVGFPESGFHRQREVRAYTKRADSGRKITREFCPICGSGINNRLEMVPGLVVIKGGTLDDPLAVGPTYEVHARNKAPNLRWGAPLRSFQIQEFTDLSQIAWKAT